MARRLVTPDEEGQALSLAVRLGEWATSELAGAVPCGVRQKADGELVTDWDLRIERAVRDELQAAFPDHQCAGEEFGTQAASDDLPTWWIDPIDGTTNF